MPGYRMLIESLSLGSELAHLVESSRLPSQDKSDSTGRWAEPTSGPTQLRTGRQSGPLKMWSILSPILRVNIVSPRPHPVFEKTLARSDQSRR